MVIKIINDVNTIDSANELKLVSEYLAMIVKLKPQYANEFNKFINQINQKLKNYDYSITKVGLKKYVKEKREKKYNLLLNKELDIGMSIHEVELILGSPDSIVLEDEYELWIYNPSGVPVTYFFKNYFLIKIN